MIHLRFSLLGSAEWTEIWAEGELEDAANQMIWAALESSPYEAQFLNEDGEWEDL